uniref:Nerve growth factor n=1 Tax=Esox lucius TaxID=8010 RepID=A0AAY5KIC7_ESOLU
MDVVTSVWWLWQDMLLLLSAHRTAFLPQDRNSSLGHSETESSSTDSIPEVDPKLFNKRHFRSSPRVVFSDVRPTHHGGGFRVKRMAGVQHLNRGEYSVCESKNMWVNLTKATDMAGNEVDILPEVKINNYRMKQYFYETICDTDTPPEGGAKSGCRGIDSRRWNSYCTNSHMYVRALTKFKELTAWRLIRINSACVCVISRKSWKH